MSLTEDIIQREHEYMVPTYTRYPIVIVKGKGIKVWDLDGKEYIDFFGQGVNAVGHCHPKVTTAIREQVEELVHFSNLYYTLPQIELAEKLSKLSFGGKVFFANSGAEANEAAIKLARKAGGPDRYEIITMYNSFHGRTMATLTATGQKKIQNGFEPLVTGFTYLPFNDPGAVEVAINEKTCAILCEPIQGEGGVNVAEESYFKGLRSLCDRYELLFILDEVQTGIGRTGRMFAYEDYGIIPDIITLAKWLGSGVPIGAMVVRREMADTLTPSSHASTFGGNPLVCAATLAVLEIIEEEGLVENAHKMGAYLKDKLTNLKDTYPFVKEVRGKGLMIGLELTLNQEIVRNIVKRCLSEGLIINAVCGNVLRMLPPLVVTDDDINKAVKILDGVLGQE